MMFDSVPPWFSQRTLKEHKLSRRYITPPMPFALTADEGIGLTGRIPGVVAARDIALPPVAGSSSWLSGHRWTASACCGTGGRASPCWNSGEAHSFFSPRMIFPNGTADAIPLRRLRCAPLEFATTTYRSP